MLHSRMLEKVLVGLRHPFAEVDASFSPTSLRPTRMSGCKQNARIHAAKAKRVAESSGEPPPGSGVVKSDV